MGKRKQKATAEEQARLARIANAQDVAEHRQRIEDGRQAMRESEGLVEGDWSESEP